MDIGQEILFLSFSRAAVARIIEASKAEIPSDKLKCLSVQTFHSFCWELVRAHGYLLGAPKGLQLLLPHDERALSGGLSEKDEEWPAWLGKREILFREEGKIVFDLFAPKASELLARSSLVRNLIADKFPLIIVDEAQDTGPDAWLCIQLVSPHTQVVCLADLGQQIFDHLPGIGPQRIQAIRETLKPCQVDLGGENHRSQGTEIAAFPEDLFMGRVRGSSYHGVSRLAYDPRGEPGTRIRVALSKIFDAVKKAKGDLPESIAILSPYGSSVERISANLSFGERPVRHKIMVDEVEPVLSATLLAFLIEPKSGDRKNPEIAESLELVAAIKRSGGTKTGGGQSSSMMNWAKLIRQGRMPKAEIVRALALLHDRLKSTELTGNPEADWLQISHLLRMSGHADLMRAADQVTHVVSFKRGKRFFKALSAMWVQGRQYTHAREALKAAIAEDQMLGGTEDVNGIHLMTIHKSKGKQFDAVIVVREGWRMGPKRLESSFVWRDDPPPYPRSRKILRVAVTRARSHVLILDPHYPKCPIISPYTL
jgi:DNA helicase-2/ATP-dependent DNA helicase PcrA